MHNLKYYLIGLIIATLIGLGVAIKIQSNKIKQLNTELSVSLENNKAYEAEKDSLRNKTYQFQYTIAQLNESKDSLVQRMNDIRKQLKIKDKQLQELQHITSVVQKSDSIFVHDTIFKVNAKLDTLIGDD
jgi:TolA-binding protein